MPPKLGERKQFTKSEVALTAKIAATRVHVERKIQRLKVFKILKGKLEFTLLPHINEIVTVVAALVNMKTPILADKKFME